MTVASTKATVPGADMVGDHRDPLRSPCMLGSVEAAVAGSTLATRLIWTALNDHAGDRWAAHMEASGEVPSVSRFFILIGDECVRDGQTSGSVAGCR